MKECGTLKVERNQVSSLIEDGLGDPSFGEDGKEGVDGGGYLGRFSWALRQRRRS